MLEHAPRRRLSLRWRRPRRYKIGEVPSDRSQKNAAEGATFSAAVLPLVHHCSPEAAAAISVNLKFGLFDAGTYASWVDVKSAFEETYACLGITCAQVGGLVDSDGALLASSTAACTPAPVAAYIPGSDVSEVTEIDLDQKAMETALKAGDWATATTHYSTGGGSVAADGSARTLQGLSTGAQAATPTSSKFADYYGSSDYADQWVSAALAGRGMAFESARHGPNDFSTLGDAARIEAVKKGTAYMNVWMRVVRAFEGAAEACSACSGDCSSSSYSLNSASVLAWDEGVAFYVGSLEGAGAGGSSSGKLVYRLAEKRCANFGTCGLLGDATSGTSKVNHELLARFTEGARLLRRGECAAVQPVVDKIVSLMTVPLVQGSLRYACAPPA